MSIIMNTLYNYCITRQATYKLPVISENGNCMIRLYEQVSKNKLLLLLNL